MFKVGIIGASGYAGFELIKLLSKHSAVELKVINSKSFADVKVKKLYPEFGNGQLEFTNYTIEEINQMNLDLLFLAVPSGIAMKMVPKIIKKTKIIDLSPDYRLKNGKLFETVYGIKHLDAKNLKNAVYGLPELFRVKIKKARLVSNPGCYATAMILTGTPLAKLAKYIIFDCKSGYSGAGREETDNKEYQTRVKDNIMAYKVVKHRHLYEVRQALPVRSSFTPHVFGTFRGIMCTAHVLLKRKTDANKIKDAFKKFYAKEKFVKISDELPDLHSVHNSNNCIIGGFEVDDLGRLVIVSTLDNLQKGASGQAVQNMNLMLGFKEGEGLSE